jgi:hypothetical protein
MIGLHLRKETNMKQLNIHDCHNLLYFKTQINQIYLLF